MLANFFMVLMAVTYGLLALQAEPITAAMGWFFCIVVLAGIIAKWKKSN